MRSYFLFFLFAAFGCKQKGLLVTPDFKTPGPPAIVYQTKKDYSNLVPVILSADKKTIVSYPSPSDIQNLPKPSRLQKNWFLDNRGITENVAFVNMTWEEYAKLKEAPMPAELMEKLIDSDPLEKMCNCGLRKAFSNPENQINELIKSNQLTKRCKVIK
jgi:hypothetical protein